MVAGPVLTMVVTALLVCALVGTWRVRGSRPVVRRAPLAPSPATGQARREAAVREARCRLERRARETRLTASDLAVPRQRPVRG